MPATAQEGDYDLDRYFHGTDAASAIGLLNGNPLDAHAATSMKIDGPPGFFLASLESEAEFFALRRSSPVVLRYNLSENAVTQLQAAGALIRLIPRGPRSPFFQGNELHVPPSAFVLFDQLRLSLEIVVAPCP